jgi:hypothetical protein
LALVTAGSASAEIVRGGGPEPAPLGRSALDAGGGSAKVISGVPAYNWYHGCGPTAAASIVGYYDLHGFDNLFDASGWDEVKLTANVQDQISSPAHNAKYDPDPDDPDLPVPPNTSIACWFRTSVDLPYGWSYLTYSNDALSGYMDYRGYMCISWFKGYGVGEFAWDDLVNEIDANRPLMFLVDTDGDYATDHFVPVLGYDDRGIDGKYYGCYTTWSEDETVVWKEFRGTGAAWGVGYATFAYVVPEPCAFSLLAAGWLVLIRRRRT